MKSNVVIVRCDAYDAATVDAAVRRGVDLLGGMRAYARPGERILLKPNVLWATRPEKCVVTHPAVVACVARLLLEHGVRVTCGDSPGGIGSCAATLRQCGFTAALEGLPVTLADFDHGRMVSHPAGVSSKALFLAHGALDADGIISLPKLKTHGLVTLTCAVKNQFGCVPGMTKGEYHARFPDSYDFSRLLAEITARLRPRLYIADAIQAMEGNGPQSGDPKPLRCILLSSDPVALDTVACRLVACPPDCVPTIASGMEAGLGTSDETSIELAGDPIGAFIDPSFRIKKTRPVPMPGSRFLRGLRRHVTRRPVISAASCTRCGRCIQVCPVDPKAVNWRTPSATARKKAPPRYDYRRCIRCFCCHEMCPSRAIVIKRPLAGRLLPFVSYLALLAAHLNSRLNRSRGPVLRQGARR
ncbi:MAG: DUF362 domain-containing protein [Chitinispirillaceae bacterium]|nr:DUF362 domain-containing protein [Chitinispirillaceae bacterium]